MCETIPSPSFFNILNTVLKQVIPSELLRASLGQYKVIVIVRRRVVRPMNIGDFSGFCRVAVTPSFVFFTFPKKRNSSLHSLFLILHVAVFVKQPGEHIPGDGFVVVPREGADLVVPTGGPVAVPVDDRLVLGEEVFVRRVGGGGGDKGLRGGDFRNCGRVVLPTRPGVCVHGPLSFPQRVGAFPVRYFHCFFRGHQKHASPCHFAPVTAFTARVP
mmetsp:Transcript_10510/g.38948  ORF Transcript_10510/g.38948 Transcript_10510/m.38948 type:complete len:216 (-) Transcript_10510:880-1527(-)